MDCLRNLFVIPHYSYCYARLDRASPKGSVLFPLVHFYKERSGEWPCIDFGVSAYKNFAV